MKKSLALVLVAVLVAAMIAPAIASAGNGKGKAKGKGQAEASAPSVTAAPRKGGGASDTKAAAKEARRSSRTAGKESRRAVTEAATEEPASTEASPSADAVEPNEPADAPGPGVSNAFTRITANIEKALVKIAAGTKKQVPPGLIRVWLKFAGWLGVDPSTMPGAPAGAASGESTTTVVPTSTIDPSPSTEPTVTLVPEPPVNDPAATPAP